MILTKIQIISPRKKIKTQNIIMWNEVLNSVGLFDLYF